MQIQENTNKKSRADKKCAICNVMIDLSTRYHTTNSFCIVCEQCYSGFSKNDINLMVDIFRIYGGYFGKLKNKLNYSRKEMIDDFFYQVQEKGISIKDLNIQVLHKSLLHGIGPKEHLQTLRCILNDSLELV